MTKKVLIEEIEAYASAKASGNPTLIHRQGEVLKRLLDAFPDELQVTLTEPAQEAVVSSSSDP